MGAYQILVDANKKILIEKELNSKDQKNNITKGAEAIIFLDMVQIVYHKLREINSSRVIMFCDNKYVERMLGRSMMRVNHFNQDVVAEGVAINRLINQIQIRVKIERIDHI